MKQPSRDYDPAPHRRLPIGRALAWLAVAGIYLLPFLSLDGAIRIHLKLGEIEGESQTKGHEQEIDILSWSWSGARNTSNTTTSGREGSGTKQINALVLTKRTDKATPAILLNCFTGKHLDEAKLTVTQSGADGPFDFLLIELKNVLVTSCNLAGDDQNQNATEHFALNFDYFQSTYTLFDSRGGKGETSEVFWSLSTDTGGGSGSSGGSGGDPTTPTNRAPIISDIPDQAVEEDGSVTVNFSVSDPETPAGSLILGRSSSHPTLLPLSDITFGGSGTTRTATLTPAPNQNGSCSVVITVSDGSRIDSSTFSLTVNPVNDPPSLQQPGAQVTQAGLPLDLAITLADIDTPIDQVTLTGQETPPAIVSSIADTTLTGNIRTLRIEPLPGATGTSTITLTATDNATPPGQTQTSFSFTVNPTPGSGPDTLLVNGLDATNAIIVNENLPNDTELGVLTATGPAGQEYEFSLLDDAGGRFGIGGPDQRRLVVRDGSLLDFEDEPDHTILLRATDRIDPLHSRTEIFQVMLENVNEAPAVFLPPTFGTTPPDRDFSLGGILVDDPDSGSEDIVVSFTVTSGILLLNDSGALAGKVIDNGTDSLSVMAPLDQIQSALSGAGGLIYRSDPDFSGTETVTVTTDDRGHTGPPGPQSDLAASSLTVELTKWEQWRRTHFDSTELLDPTISSFTADPDRDGLRNGGEYGVNGDPRDPESGPNHIQLVYLESDNEIYPALTFTRLRSDPDFAVTVEIATDLLNWVSGPAYTTAEFPTPIDADYDQLTARSLAPLSANRNQQLRLRFSLSTP